MLVSLSVKNLPVFPAENIRDSFRRIGERFSPAGQNSQYLNQTNPQKFHFHVFCLLENFWFTINLNFCPAQKKMIGQNFSMKSSTISEDAKSSGTFDPYGRSGMNKVKPITKYYPSSVSVDFWEANFGNFDEVAIEQFIESLIPVIEREINAKFYYNQIMNMIDAVNYENRHVIFLRKRYR